MPEKDKVGLRVQYKNLLSWFNNLRVQYKNAYRTVSAVSGAISIAGATIYMLIAGLRIVPFTVDLIGICAFSLASGLAGIAEYFDEQFVWYMLGKFKYPSVMGNWFTTAYWVYFVVS